jgi:YggT family protein
VFVLTNFLTALTDLLDWFLGAAIILVIVRALLSWVNPDPYNALVRAINTLSEPFLKPFRRLLPPWKLNGLDLSPVFAVLALEFVRRFVIPTLWDVISRLKAN